MDYKKININGLLLIFLKLNNKIKVTNMKMKYSLDFIITQILRLLLILFVFHFILKQDYLFAIAAFVAVALSLVPAIIKRNYHFTLPWPLESSIVVALFLHIIGISFNLYYIPLWSNFMHFSGTAIIALLAFIAVYALNFTNKVKLSLFMIGFFTFIFAIAIGALWEIGEFFCDIYLNTFTQQGSLIDTMMDLIFDSIAGIIIAIVGILYVKSTPRKADDVIRNMIEQTNEKINKIIEH